MLNRDICLYCCKKSNFRAYTTVRDAVHMAFLLEPDESQSMTGEQLFDAMWEKNVVLCRLPIGTTFCRCITLPPTENCWYLAEQVVNQKLEGKLNAE